MSSTPVNSLFEPVNPGDSETISLEGGLLRYWPQAVDWQQSHIRIAGRVIPIPRLNAWYGDPGADYSYPGVRLETLSWLPELVWLKNKVQQLSGYRFNSALVNLYRHGWDSVDWHADDEPELGIKPVVASVSLGTERRFELRPRSLAGKAAAEKATGARSRGKILALDLASGSLLLMAGSTQQHWQHRLPKVKTGNPEETGPRINITFRSVGIPEA